MFFLKGVETSVSQYLCCVCGPKASGRMPAAPCLLAITSYPDLSYGLSSRAKWRSVVPNVALDLPFRILGTTAWTTPCLPIIAGSPVVSFLRAGLNDTFLCPTLDFVGAHQRCGALFLRFLLPCSKHLVCSVEIPQTPVQGHHS